MEQEAKTGGDLQDGKAIITPEDFNKFMGLLHGVRACKDVLVSDKYLLPDLPTGMFNLRRVDINGVVFDAKHPLGRVELSFAEALSLYDFYASIRKDREPFIVLTNDPGKFIELDKETGIPKRVL